MVIVVLGVSGSGKTTIGTLLAEQLGWTFADADDFHSDANKAKMHAGVPLTDEDRAPWLEALHLQIQQWLGDGKGGVLACSGLKERYRKVLSGGHPQEDVAFVYLHGSYELIAARLAARKGHYMNPALLKSQFDALEEPADALRVEIDQSAEAVVGEIRQALGI